VPSDEQDESYFERRARQMGLPTDPEAYQDGGLVPVASSSNQMEAEIIASVLNAADVPAWVESPNMAHMLGMANPGLFPEGVRVLVPLGRLEDAKKVLAESRRQGEP
jgi:hypothetical protein